MKIEVYCDGSSEGNSTGRGGWGFILVHDDVERHRESGGLSKATNNIAELTGAIRGLEYLSNNRDACDADAVVWLVSDSKLVLGYASGEFQCKALHLAPLYCKLRKLYKELNCKTRWVKGHQGNHFNEECDILAKSAREAVDGQIQTK